MLSTLKTGLLSSTFVYIQLCAALAEQAERLALWLGKLEETRRELDAVAQAQNKPGFKLKGKFLFTRFELFELLKPGALKTGVELAPPPPRAGERHLERDDCGDITRDVVAQAHVRKRGST